MKIFGLNITRDKKEEKPQTKKRDFSGAKIGGIYSGWIANNNTADVDIQKDLRTLRARSRELMRNDDYAKRFKRMIKTNVVGQKGIRLQNKAKKLNGELLKNVNDLIELEFNKWSKKGTCDVTGKYSFRELQKIAISTVAEDGEVIIRKVKNFPNRYGFALQILEADHLDENFNDPSRNIFMSIEYDGWGKPTYYHLLKSHPGKFYNTDNTRERIKAEDIIHLFIPLRISATRGVPWMHTAMSRMKMVNGYEEAELTASRIAAAKGGFYVTKDKDSESIVSDDYYEDEGVLIDEVQAGQIELLPRGVEFEAYDPQHPNSSFKEFMKVVLRGIASGLDVSYNVLANDLEGVNYSSLRSGILEEREVWKELQQWLAENMLDSIFTDWLEMATLKQTISIEHRNIDKYNAPSWLFRGFSWVDPLKDTQANIMANKEGLKTHTQIANEMGIDLEEMYQQLAKEQDLREKYGIVLEDSKTEDSEEK
jgi:lambda family phage portal protein